MAREFAIILPETEHPKRGRPPSGHAARHVTLRLPLAELAALDCMAQRRGVTRTAAIREAIRAAVDGGEP